MGFLDHSTNNIILDAVLTDVGRQFLSRNDGSFSIVKFALGDDEIDYSIIKKFGRTVGKEKIEKNTPVLEALTQGNLGLKYRLVPVTNTSNLGSLTFTIQAKSVSNSVHTTYKQKGGSVVQKVVEISGMNSGAFTSFKVQVS